MTVKAVIFDCDGTLVDSEELGTVVLLEYAREFGFDSPIEETVKRFRGHKLEECVAEIEYTLGQPLPMTFI